MSDKQLYVENIPVKFSIGSHQNHISIYFRYGNWKNSRDFYKEEVQILTKKFKKLFDSKYTRLRTHEHEEYFKDTEIRTGKMVYMFYIESGNEVLRQLLLDILS